MIALCRDVVDETKACPFVSACDERRQRIAAGYALFGGGTYSTTPMYAPLRGNACSWYQWGAEKRPGMLPQVEIDVERAAIEEKGLAT